MRQFIMMTVACGLIALIIWPRPVAASVDIVFFRAVSGQAKITLEWETETETDFLGFYLYRSLTSDLDDADLISPLIPAQGLPPTGGAFYTFNDTNVVNNVIYYYWLGSLDNGQTEPNSYEGPASATTLGGTTINTPVPTSQGSSPATATPTPSPSPTTNGPTTTPAPTTRATTGAASPTATDEPEPSPTINLTPTRIPAGTFPQPPTPTRFTFSPTPGSQATPSANGGDGSSGNNGSSNGDPDPDNDASEPPTNEFTTPVVPVPLDGATATTIAALPDNPANSSDNGVAVIGQSGDAASSAGNSTDLLPPPGTVPSVVQNERSVSPLLIMGLLVGTVFTFGGALTTFFIVFRKR